MTGLFLSSVCESAFFLGQAWCQYSLEAAGGSCITGLMLCTASASVTEERVREVQVLTTRCAFFQDSFVSGKQIDALKIR